MPGAELSWDQIEATQNAANEQAGHAMFLGAAFPCPTL
jgi:hypothetical protein